MSEEEILNPKYGDKWFKHRDYRVYDPGPAARSLRPVWIASLDSSGILGLTLEEFRKWAERAEVVHVAG